MKIQKMLRIHEGVRSHVYTCSAGYETIGVGRNISETGLGLSEDEITYLLENDISRVRAELSSAFTWFDDLDEVRRDAMIDIAFNIGLSRLMTFKKALTAMNQQDYDKAASEFLDSRWSVQVGARSKRVAGMIKTGEYPDEFK
tara:strand:- start:13 stop:441 length:429 start_codon:yes stop_codon:yes gene_type:complete